MSVVLLLFQSSPPNPTPTHKWSRFSLTLWCIKYLSAYGSSDSSLNSQTLLGSFHNGKPGNEPKSGNIDLTQIWQLFISINWFSPTKEMNPITRNSMSRLVMQYQSCRPKTCGMVDIRDKCMVASLHFFGWYLPTSFPGLFTFVWERGWIFTSLLRTAIYRHWGE